jgi:N-acyl-D-amino-acid deacylase
MEEAFLVGREAGVPVLLSHHKVTGKDHWGQTARTLSRFDEVRRTQPVSLDVYPYDASSTVLKMDAARRSSKVVVTWSKAKPEAAGRTLTSLAEDFCCSEEQAAARLQPAGAVYWAMDEDDVRRVLCHPCAMVGSDGLPNDEIPHPRLFGSFPRVLGRYCREERLFSLEECVRKLSALPASVFGFTDRGTLEVGKSRIGGSSACLRPGALFYYWKRLLGNFVP